MRFRRQRQPVQMNGWTDERFYLPDPSQAVNKQASNSNHKEINPILACKYTVLLNKLYVLYH